MAGNSTGGQPTKRFAQFKAVLLGESAVGKDKFDELRESTIGAAFVTHLIPIDETTTVKFEIWDTAGQERYKSLAPMYYRNADVAIVVYDISQKFSFSRAQHWVNELKLSSRKASMVIALVGNKSDLESVREVDKQAVERYCLENNLLCYECSAKTGSGVQSLFRNIAKALPIDKAIADQSRGSVAVDLNAEEPRSSTCSC